MDTEQKLYPPTIDQIRTAADRLCGIRRTPLIQCDIPGLTADVFLKLENIQFAGSFKLRGAGNAILKAAARGIQHVWTASAGNMGLGVAWYANRAGLESTVFVPDDAPQGKIEAIQFLGAKVIQLPRDEYWEIQKTHQRSGTRGYFVHPFADTDVMAGNGTIALEVLDELDDVDTVITPYGGGGLSCGIASALQALSPSTVVFAAETENGAPLKPSLETGRMMEVDYWKSFVSGIGSPTIFPQMWPLVNKMIAGSVVVSLPEIADSMRALLDTHHLVTEGAGAISLAAARTGSVPGRVIVCVLTGGNIKFEELNQISQESI